jgi:Flp pilus assembly protein TadG
MGHRNPRCHRGSRRGAVAAEAAIVLPIFILAIIGIIEFGRAVMVQQILTNAAREGARRAIIQGATNDEVTELVGNYIDAGIGTSPSREIGILDASDGALDLEDANSHDLIKVVVTVPYDEVGVGISSYFAGKTMGAVCQMRKE